MKNFLNSTVISTFVVAFISLISLYIRSRLKKKEYNHSIQSKTQVKVLENIYKYFVELEYSINIIFSTFQGKHKNPYNAKLIEKWNNNYIETRKYYSSKKYIIPKKVIKTCDLCLDRFENLQKVLDIEKEINYLFVSTGAELWESELVKGCEKEYELLNKELQQYNSEKIFKQSIKQIQELKINIKKHLNFK